MEWKKIPIDSNKINLRYGHSAIMFQKKLILFGGRIKINNYVFSGDLEVFNLEDKSWTNPIIFTKSTLKLRSFHAAELIGIMFLLT